GGGAPQPAAAGRDRGGERADAPTRPARRERYPSHLEREHDHLRHEGGHRIVGPETGVEDPRREEGSNQVRAKLPLEPGTLGRHGVANEGAQLPRAAGEKLLEKRLRGRPAPRLLAEDGEDERRVAFDLGDRGAV